MLGDLLLTGPSQTNDAKVLPSFRIPNETTTLDEDAVKGLRQKLVLLSARVAVAWSGTYCFAKSVIKDLQELEADGRLTAAAFEQYLSDNPIEASGLALILFLLDGDQLSVHQHDCKKIEWGKFLAVAGGSGLGEFSQKLFDSMNESELLDEGDPRPSALNSAFHSLAPLLGVEFFSNEYLRQGFGGGYEVITTSNGSLTKLDSIAYVIWTGAYDMSTGRLRLAPPRALTIQYYDHGYLVIRTFLFGLNSTTDPFDLTETQHLHIVEPMIKSERSLGEVLEAAYSAALSPEWVCNVLMIANSEMAGGNCIVDFSTAVTAADRSIRLEVPGRGLGIQPGYADYIEELLNRQNRDG